MTRRDPWLKRLAITAAVCLGVALVLLVGFTISLDSGVSELRAVVLESRR